MNILETAIGWVAPARCVGCGVEGTSLCPLCLGLEILPYGQHCGLCSRLSPDGLTCTACRRLGAPSNIWISTDYSALSKSLLQIYKFRHQRAAASPLAEIMTATFLQSNDDEQIARRRYLVVPVPTATSRVRARGFDHAELLAVQIARRLKLELAKSLKRLGQSRQVGAKRSTRLTQQAGNYSVPRPDKIAGRNILLIDDVLTTGATLIAARKALRQAGARRVDALVFAKRL